jgi:DNA-binding MarR family transcriptional regulator
MQNEYACYADAIYIDSIALLERRHRQFLEVVKLELDAIGVHDINNVQAMILYNIGDLKMSTGDLTLRGCYQGTNVSYNVKKLVGNGYLVQERSPHDRRSIHVRLTEKGFVLRDKLSAMHERHVTAPGRPNLPNVEDLVQALATLRRLDRFYSRIVEIDARDSKFAPVNHSKSLTSTSSITTRTARLS